MDDYNMDDYIESGGEFGCNVCPSYVFLFLGVFFVCAGDRDDDFWPFVRSCSPWRMRSTRGFFPDGDLRLGRSNESTAPSMSLLMWSTLVDTTFVRSFTPAGRQDCLPVLTTMQRYKITGQSMYATATRSM